MTGPQNIFDGCLFMNNKYANFNPKKKYNTCREMEEVNFTAFLYKVLEANLRKFIKDLCVTLFPK
jgi:hypothetical protein